MFFCDFAFPGSAMSASWATLSLFEPSIAIQASDISLSRHFPAHIFRKTEVRSSEMSLLKKPDSRDEFHKHGFSWEGIDPNVSDPGHVRPGTTRPHARSRNRCHFGAGIDCAEDAQMHQDTLAEEKRKYLSYNQGYIRESAFESANC